MAGLGGLGGALMRKAPVMTWIDHNRHRSVGQGSRLRGPQCSFIFGENDLPSFSAFAFCNSVEPGQV